MIPRPRSLILPGAPDFRPPPGLLARRALLDDPLPLDCGIGTPVPLGSAHGSSGAGPNAVVITTGADSPAGSTILVGISYGSISITSVTDSAGNTYVQDINVINLTRALLFRSTTGLHLPSGGTISVNPGNTNVEVIAEAVAVSGLVTASPIDVSNTAIGTSATPSVSATTANAVDLLIGLVSGGNSAANVTSPASPWNDLGSINNADATGQSLGWSYQIVSVTGTYTYNPALSVSEGWAAGIIAYKGAPPPPPYRRPNAALYRR